LPLLRLSMHIRTDIIPEDIIVRPIFTLLLGEPGAEDMNARSELEDNEASLVERHRIARIFEYLLGDNLPS
jgi:hypothetical protein